MYIYYYYGLGANDSNQAKGGTALGNEPDDEGEKVGGDEAMEPNFESLGRSRGGDDDEDDGCDGCIIIILQTTGTQKPRVSQSRWRSEAEDEARWIYKKE